MSTGANLDCLVNFAAGVFSDSLIRTLFIKLRFILRQWLPVMVNGVCVLPAAAAP